MSGIHIDVPCTRINAWLCNRGRLKKKWQTDLREIHKRIKEARKLLDVGLQEEFEGDEIGYFEVLKIIAALEVQEKEQGKSVKTFFGGYSSDLLRTWDDIRKAYLQENIYLAECGRTLTQRLKYDIPRMKKLIQESGKQISDLGRKMTDREQLSRELRAKYRARCEELNIRGVNVKQEIQRTVAGLQKALEEVAENARVSEIEEGIQLYLDYVKFLNGFSSEEKGTKKTKLELPSLRGIARIAEAQPYDFKASEAESNEKEVENGWSLVGETPAENSKSNEVEIDWGISEGDAEEENKQVDTKKDLTDEADTGGINWDIDVADEGKGEETEIEMGEGQIDWDITLDEDEGDRQDAPAEVGRNNTSDSVENKNLKPKHILEDESLRNSLTNDLLELKCFFKQRLAELENGDSIGATQYRKMLPELDLAKRCTTSSLTKYLAAVEKVLSSLKSENLQRMLLIQCGERYVTRLAESVVQIERNATRMMNSISDIRTREQSIRNSVSQTATSLDRATKGCKEIQSQLEKTLKTMFPEASGVRIVGDINRL